jgi:hypothetical protein
MGRAAVRTVEALFPSSAFFNNIGAKRSTNHRQRGGRSGPETNEAPVAQFAGSCSASGQRRAPYSRVPGTRPGRPISGLGCNAVARPASVSRLTD